MEFSYHTCLLSFDQSFHVLFDQLMCRFHVKFRAIKREHGVMPLSMFTKPGVQKSE